jgi:hypothetical protein
MEANESDPSGKNEPLFNPELIQESPFRIPSICRAGDEYKFENLYLPNGWSKRVVELGGQVPDTDFQVNKALKLHDGEFICEPDKAIVERDEETRVVTKITIPTKHIGISELVLRRGTYWAKNVRSVEVAAAMLSFVSHELSFSYAPEYQHYTGWQFPSLFIPKRYLDINKKVLNEFGQEDFLHDAYNIVGQFGETYLKLDFNEKNGIPSSISIIPSAGLYFAEYDKDTYHYFGHNINNPTQAAILHAIVSKFINELLEE